MKTWVRWLASAPIALLIIACVWSGACSTVVEQLRSFYFRKYYEHRHVEVHPWVPLGDTLYTLEYQDTYWPLLFGGAYGYDRMLTYVVLAEQQQQPVFDLQFVPLPIADPWVSVWKELDLGTPRDIISGPAWMCLGDERLLPVDLFLPEQYKENSSLRGMTALQQDGQTWGFPRWIEPAFFVGNRVLLERAGIDVQRVRDQGWSPEEFAEACTAMKEKRIAVGISDPVSLLVALCLAEGTTLLECSDKQLYMPLSVVSNTGATQQSELLYAFWEGEVGLYGPAGAGFLRYWRDRLSRLGKALARDVDPVILPLPTREGSPYLSTVNAVFAFVTPGERADRSRLAVEVARSLAEHTVPIIARQLMVVPARAMVDWKSGAVLPQEELSYLESLASIPVRPVTRFEAYRQLIAKDKIEACLRRVMARKMSVEKAAQEIVEILLENKKDRD
ncbi:MAG: hypothetical protein AB1497_03845 [Bacillota bacterium]